MSQPMYKPDWLMNERNFIPYHQRQFERNRFGFQGYNNFSGRNKKNWTWFLPSTEQERNVVQHSPKDRPNT